MIRSGARVGAFAALVFVAGGAFVASLIIFAGAAQGAHHIGNAIRRRR